MRALQFHRIFCVAFLFWTITCRDTNGQETGVTTSDSERLYFFHYQPEIPKDCKEIHDQCSSSNSSGVFYIQPDGYPEPFEVYCGNGVDSRGWTVISSRNTNGIISFNRSWEDYKRGFGFLSHEFWIGNERLSYLTNQKKYQLLIEMTISNGSTIDVSHNNFRIGDEFSKYKLISLDHTADANPWTWCPDNMVYGDCTCGQRLCRDPATCQNTCLEGRSGGCICPEGFYMSGEDCIPQQQCGCYIAQERTIVPEGETFMNAECTRIAVCSNGRLTRNDVQRCSPNAVCEERRGTRRCYCNEGHSGDGVTCTVHTDCMDIYNNRSTTSGIYTIKPSNWPGSAFEVYCNMTDGGGWTVFQKRFDGSLEFYRDWNSYKDGFGSTRNEHWLGNDKLYYLTNQKKYRLRIDLVDRYGTPYYAKYTFFRINNEADKYRLSRLGTYSGTAGNSLGGHHNAQFSTRGRDNDGISHVHCAERYRSGWWFSRTTSSSCRYSDLNSVFGGGDYRYHSLYWSRLPGDRTHYLIFTEMKVKPI